MRQAELSRLDELVVTCPVCTIAVDIREAYDAVLCRSCQKQILAKGDLGLRVKKVMLQARMIGRRCQALLAISMLCLIFGAQGLLSMVLWQLCQDTMENMSHGNSTSVHGHAGDDPLAVLLQPFLQAVVSNRSGTTARPMGKAVISTLGG
jgi:hypothetical protein